MILATFLLSELTSFGMTSIAAVVEKVRQPTSSFCDFLPGKTSVSEDQAIFIRSRFGDGFVDFSDSELLHRQNLGFIPDRLRVKVEPLDRYRL